MTAPQTDPLRAHHFERTERQYRSARGAARVLGAALLIALALRSLLFEPFNIPSQSMLPTLLAGDYLFVAKWPYGYSRYSLPLGLPLFDGRIGDRLPERGDVVVFKTPRDNRTDFIKRVIGLPGDRVRMVDGQLELNGVLVAKQRIADFVLAFGQRGDCGKLAVQPSADTSRALCRVPTYIETLGRHRYTVLDQIDGGIHDTTASVVVPAGHYFVAGDNRDDSADSRLTLAEGGVGMVPAENLIGRADRIFFSVDDNVSFGDPASWRRALRWSRIGRML